MHLSLSAALFIAALVVLIACATIAANRAAKRRASHDNEPSPKDRDEMREMLDAAPLDDEPVTAQDRAALAAPREGSVSLDDAIIADAFNPEPLIRTTSVPRGTAKPARRKVTAEKKPARKKTTMAVKRAQKKKR